MKMWQKVLIGMILGIIVGIILKQTDQKEIAEDLKTVGTIFIDLIKMILIPLIFFALLSGITSMDDPQSASRVGIKAISIYLATAMFAVVIGIVVALIVRPGVGLPSDMLTSLSSAKPVVAAAPPSIKEFFLGLVPHNIFGSMTESNAIHVIFFTVFMGIVMNILGEKVAKVRALIQETAQIMFKMIEYIVKLAPIAVFCFMAWMIGTLGVDAIKSLVLLVAAVLIACSIQYILFGVLIMVFGRLSPSVFYRKMLPTQSMAFATSSSKATLTTAMRELQERLGVSERSTNFVMPLGACINMDGTAIYLGICAVFFSQMMGIDLQLHQYLLLIITCTLGSIGAAGIPSGSIIFMGMVLSSVGIPIEGIGIILGVDRVLDMVRTTINITGDSTVTLLVDRSEKLLDEKKYYADI
ncbi:MAG: dicarboxylate/amino acid:cation symporter [Alphaproteobacteria bacterium]|nr:dicarboxylate/amino acid:cation symporter [Alphaproteobacteria bacterium]